MYEYVNHHNVKMFKLLSRLRILISIKKKLKNLRTDGINGIVFNLVYLAH